MQPHFGIFLAELLDDLGQHVTRLRVRRRDRERAADSSLKSSDRRLMFCTSRRIPHCAVDHLLAGRRHARQVAAVAHEDLEAELVLEQLDLLRHARLRRVQLLGRRGDVDTLDHHRSLFGQQAMAVAEVPTVWAA